MNKYGVLMKRESKNGSYATFSHNVDRGEHLFVVHYHWTAFDAIGNDDTYAYHSARDAYEMFRIYNQRGYKTYFSM